MPGFVGAGLVDAPISDVLVGEVSPFDVGIAVDGAFSLIVT